MLMLIVGGSFVAGSDNPHDGTSMPLEAVHPICRTRNFQPLDFAAGICLAVDGCKNGLDWASTVTACMFSRLGTG
jgi:hypothetical protein